MPDNSRTTFALDTNLEGRIRNLALAPSPLNSVYPMLEAIMNGIQAIHDRFGVNSVEKGKIQIEIDRNDKDINISISDNGIGLDNKNFDAFLIPDTDHKLKKGGKGIGRLTWLKTFNKTEVSSTFYDNSSLYSRCFTFNVDNTDTINNHHVSEIFVQKECGTTINLLGMRDGYAQQLPAKLPTIASHIIRHFFPIFISEKHPEIILKQGTDFIDIYKELKNNIKERISERFTFNNVNGKSFDLHIEHMRIDSRHAPKSAPSDLTKTGKSQNAVYFAADQRVCLDYNLDNQLGMTSFDDCKYVGVLSGEYINMNINQERTYYLNVLPEDMKNLKDKVLELVTKFLSAYMDKVKENQRYILSELEHEFPSITQSKPDNYIDSIPFSLNKSESMLSDLAIHRYRLHRKTKSIQERLDDRIKSITNSSADITSDEEGAIMNDVHEIHSKLSDQQIGSLSEYMVRRKAIIDHLDKYMGISDSGRNFKEDIIHNLICPMRRIDNTKKLLNQNLWLLDDRFMFYSFLASDAPLSQFNQSKDEKRPDVLFILDEELAFDREDKDNSPIFIIEFKRPSRKSYSTHGEKGYDAEDPFDRFMKYKIELENGISGEKTYDGRHIKISETRPIHCFLIADMTEHIDIKCKTRLSPIEGSNSYFGYIPNLGYVHAISYDDLIKNARLRHEFFFEKLGISRNYR